MPSKRKIVLFFALAGVLPVLFFTIKDIADGDVTAFDWEYLSGRLMVVLVSCVTNGLISAAVIYIPISFLEQRIPWTGNWGKRFLIEFILTELTAMSTMLILIHVYWIIGINSFKVGSQEYWNSVNLNLFITFVMNIILVAIYEGIVLFNQWKFSLIENAKLEKENIASKFEALQNQVNPHFLFNSLNTLSNLVHEDADKAEDFIDEFSHIYRYVLEKKDELVVPVQEEVEFVKSYLKLCKIRFGEALKNDVKLDVEKLDQMIPTLALQTLVENAIKHNKITKDHPLHISIFNEDENIAVQNNLQPRNEKVKSTGIGLNNIIERYGMLSNRKPTFQVVNDFYIAKLPLLQPS